MPLSPYRVLSPPFDVAMYFDGVGDYVSLNKNLVGDEGTVEVLAYVLSLPDWGNILFQTRRGTTVGAMWIGAMVNNTFNFQIYTKIGWKSIVVDNAVSLRKWYHFAGTWKVGEPLVGYLNGIVIGTSPVVLEVSPETAPPFYVGRNTERNTFFYGYVKYVRVYNIKLATDQINRNMNNPDNPVKSGLILWYKAHPDYVKDIDNDGVLEWIDLSGYGNHGKIYGAQLVQLVKTPARVLMPARVLSPVR